MPESSSIGSEFLELIDVPKLELKMTVLSAYEDFWTRTLASLPGLLRRLAYVSGLRDAAGEYAHWGLRRTYGDAAAQRAAYDSHVKLVADVLSTSLVQLSAEVERDDEEHRTAIVSLLPDRLLPDTNRDRATALHLKTVVAGLHAVLAASRRDQMPAA